MVYDISTNLRMQKPVSIMASVIGKHQYLKVVARSHGIVLLKLYRRPGQELVFFNRLWDIYERYIAEKNLEWEETHQRGSMDQWRLLVDQIVSPTDKEMECFTFGDFLDPFLDDNNCESAVCRFADEVIWDDNMMTIRSRTKGLHTCEGYPEDWSSCFHSAWDRYLLALVERRQDIWQHIEKKRTREQTPEHPPPKRVKQ
jgi:hypothetical protein